MHNSKWIAIDGPVASGKTAVGRLLARRLGYRFLDTGAMYRAVTWAALERRVDLRDAKALTLLAEALKIELVAGQHGDMILVDGRDVTNYLRAAQVERVVSQVSAVSGVRAAMVRQQRAIAQAGPIVMAGRDIGTVVLPDAGLKVFLGASLEVRARRRHREMMTGGAAADYHQVAAELVRRDKIDMERDDSPLRPAKDALELETDDISIEEVTQKLLSLLQGR